MANRTAVRYITTTDLADMPYIPRFYGPLITLGCKQVDIALAVQLPRNDSS